MTAAEWVADLQEYVKGRSVPDLREEALHEGGEPRCKNGRRAS